MSRIRQRVGFAVDRVRARADVLRGRAREALDEGATRSAARLYDVADRLSHVPFRSEAPSNPDEGVISDLAAYTALPLSVVDSLVRHRAPLDFRAEWHATPSPLQADHWFYLSSKTYLFANATHFASDDEISNIAQLLPTGCVVLEFGAGTGNLSIALGRRGHRVVADDLSALQRDFVRFRIDRHHLREQITVLDPWATAAAASVDAITAFDVLEHLPDGKTTLDQRLLPALRPGGLLIENSPFVLNVANPMHHTDWGLDEHLRTRGFTLAQVDAIGTRVWRSPVPEPR